MSAVCVADRPPMSRIWPNGRYPAASVRWEWDKLDLGLRVTILEGLDVGVEAGEHRVEVLVNGHAWDSLAAGDLVRAAAGEDAWLERAPMGHQFDILPLLVATDGAVTAFGRDIRRLRPNLLINGVEGMAETTWEGAELEIGDAIIELDSLRGRCPMTTVDPDTITRDPAVLKDIGRRFGGKLALNAAVGRGGNITVGDPVTLHRRR